jgi:hypothetical protein
MKNKDDKSKTKLFWALFIILIMISSSGAFIYDFYASNNKDNNSKQTYNGYKFEATSSNTWQTTFNGQTLQFYYTPKELESINVKDINLDTNKIYLAFNASDSDQVINFNRDRIRSILAYNNVIATPACIAEDNCPDIPIVDCKGNIPVLYLKKLINSTDININKQDNCYTVEAYNDGFNKFTDRLIYKILGIMP